MLEFITNAFDTAVSFFSEKGAAAKAWAMSMFSSDEETSADADEASDEVAEEETFLTKVWNAICVPFRFIGNLFSIEDDLTDEEIAALEAETPAESSTTIEEATPVETPVATVEPVLA